jgi:DeoR/GlpR family transcriptional regulator of sugar metabolism
LFLRVLSCLPYNKRKNNDNQVFLHCFYKRNKYNKVKSRKKTGEQAMLKQERRKQIMNLLEKEGRIVATTLSQTLNVSEDTIRRDLREMDALGLLQRVHGGALPRSTSAVDYKERKHELMDVKHSLAVAALPLIKDGQVLLMDGSTTNIQLVKAFPKNLKVTVITNSPLITVALAEHAFIEVVSLGGTFRKESMVTVGQSVVDTLKQIRADLCFLGVYAIDPKIGMSIPLLEEMHIKSQMIKSASEVAAIVTAKKLNTSSTYTFSSANSLDWLITEAHVNETVLNAYRDIGIEVITNK